MPARGKLMIVRHEAHTGLTATATAALVQGNAVKVTGVKSIGPAVAGDTTVGVSHHEVTAQQITDGNNKATFRLKGDVIPMISAGAIAAGASVATAAAGKVATRAAETAEDLVGIAWTSASAADQEILVIVL